jgi:Tat protein translocase TatB subunit
MFGLGAGEIFLVFVIGLVVFGPEKIPEIARWLGKTSADLRRMSDTVRREFYNGIYVPPPEPSAQENRATSLIASSEKGGNGDSSESGTIPETTAESTETTNKPEKSGSFTTESREVLQ